MSEDWTDEGIVDGYVQSTIKRIKLRRESND